MGGNGEMLKNETKIDNKVENKEATAVSPEEQKKLDGIKTATPAETNDAVNTFLPDTKAQKINKNMQDLDYNPYDVTLEKTQTEVKKTGEEITQLSTEYTYTTPLLTIRNMISGDSKIPSEDSGKIIEAINTLGDADKIRIVGCTDDSKIIPPDAINYNKTQFETDRKAYMTRGGICPTYDELLTDPVNSEDPQNTVLGYARAMEGVLSLNLTPDQMKKIEIKNKLGTKEDTPEERGFDVETDYSGTIDREVKSAVYTEIYSMLGNLNKENISRIYNNVTGKNGYSVNNLNFSTDGVFKKIYEDITDTKKIVGKDPVLEAKIKNQTTDYLKVLVNVCGGKYMNGVWSAKDISDKTYFLIKATDQENRILTQDEFTRLTEKGDLSILENKTLSNGQTIAQYVSELDITGVYKPSGGKYFYTTEESLTNTDDRTLERKISTKEDYLILGLYFEMKNSIKSV